MELETMKRGERSLYLRKAAVATVGVMLTMSVCGLAAAMTSVEWQAAFEEVAQPAANAMELTVPQLEAQLARCESLKGTLGDLDESARKVYGRRLQMTCDLYRFILESKKEAAGGGAAK
jgi:C4-dicarboxylate-specific signal transduction histidine kinase